MPDPYALSDQPSTPAARPEKRSPLRALLWTLLVLSVAANTITSFGVVPLAVSIGLGVVTGATAIALVSLYLRQR